MKTNKASSNEEPRRGRPIEHRLGDVLATFNVLSQGKATVRAQDIATLLDVHLPWAREIIEKLGNTPNEELDALLPLCPTENQDEVMCVQPKTTARISPMRLTASQAQVTNDAFESLGANKDNPLRQHVQDAFFPLVDEVPESTSTTTADADTFKALYVCARSIAQAERIESDVPQVEAPVVTFGYHGQNDTIARLRTRRIIPMAIHHENDLWVVDAFDIDASATRTYHAHKMVDPLLTKVTCNAPAVSSENPDGGFVDLTCASNLVSQVLTWDNAVLISLSENEGVIRVPYFRGEWLPRHVLALGDGVTFTHPRLAKEVKDAASDTLKRAKKIQAKYNERTASTAR